MASAPSQSWNRTQGPSYQASQILHIAFVVAPLPDPDVLVERASVRSSACRRQRDDPRPSHPHPFHISRTMVHLFLPMGWLSRGCASARRVRSMRLCLPRGIQRYTQELDAWVGQDA